MNGAERLALSDPQRAILYVEAALAFGVLCGLVVKGHWRQGYAFCAYLAAVGASDLLVAAWPRQLYTWEFWLAKEWLQHFLKLLLALELGVRTLQRLEVARSLYNRIMLLVLVGAGLSLQAGATDHARALAHYGGPRMLYATTIIFGALLVLCLWYHVPLHPVHKAVLVGLASYLLVFTVVLQSLATFALDAFALDLRLASAVVNTTAYVLLLVYWLSVGWRNFAGADLSPAVLRVFEPWAGRA